MSDQNLSTSATTPLDVRRATSSGANLGPLIQNFAQREMRSRYKRSLLGWLWSLINPLSTVLIYSLVFGVFLRTLPPVTDNGRAEVFALYLFIGIVVWNLFSGIVNGSMDWMAGVMDMRKKVYFPTETAIVGGVVATFVQTLFEVAILLALMIGFLNLSWTFVLIFPILIGVAALALGIGFVVAILNARYRDVRYLVNIAMSLGFFVAPIVYPIGLLDQPDLNTYGLPLAEIVRWNPVSLYVQAAHDVVYFLRLPSLGTVALMIMWSLLVPWVGLQYFRRRSMEISEEL